MKIRIKFRKYGSMRFVGHLDVMRYFQKAIRRAGIDIACTEGFSPHQIMSFAAPLGVGLTSDGEYLDIEVHSTRSSEASLAALNAVMAEGFEVTEYVALREGSAKAMAAVAAADYTVWPAEGYGLTARAIRAYYTDRPQIPVTKQGKKGERVLDLKPLIYRFEPWEENGKRGFFLRLSTGSTDHVKPELVMEDFYRFLGRDCRQAGLRIHRLELYERTEDGLRPLSAAGDKICEAGDHRA